MPPRTRFTAERILDAALVLTREQGVDAVTARNVAAQLSCSTGPVFTHFGSMDDLLEQLMDQIIARFVAYARATEHADPLVAAGLGWLRFASDEPRFYEALFLRHHGWHDKWGPVRRELANNMANHPRYCELDARARFGLVGRASIVLHGLGVEIWSGRLVADPDTLLVLLEQLAGPVVDAAIARGWTHDLHSAPVANTPT